MYLTYRQILGIPTFPDNYQMRLANLVNRVLLTIISVCCVFFVGNLVINPAPDQLVVLAICLLGTTGLKILLNLRQIQIVISLLVLFTWLIVTISVWTVDGIYSPMNGAFVLPILFAGITFKRRSILSVTVLCVISSFAIIYGMQIGLIPSLIYSTVLPEIVGAIYVMIYTIVGVLTYLSSRMFQQTMMLSEKQSIELKQSSDNLRRAEKLANLGNFEIDIQTGQVIWSDELYRIMGVNPNLLITLQTYESVLVEQTAQPLLKDIRRLIETGESFVNEYTVALTDGTYKDIYVVANPVLDEANIVVKIFGIVRDITKQKRAERMQKMLLSISRARHGTTSLEEFLQFSVEQLGQLINVTNCYIALYDETSKLYSFPYGTDKYDDNWYPQGLEDSLTDYVRRTGKAIMVDEKEHHRLNNNHQVGFFGTWSNIWLGAPLTVKQKVIGVIVVQDYEDAFAYQHSDLELLSYVAENIASMIDSIRIENSRLEIEIHKKQTMYLQEFISNMTHDMKTPLSVIKTSSDLLKMDKNPSKQTEYIDRITYQLKRLDKMIDDILMISRLEQGVKATYSLVNMNLLITQVVNQLKPKLDQKKQVVNIQLVDDLPSVLGVKDDLIRVILNLLENASNYTDYKGTIIVRTDYTEKHIICEIEDTGIGIDKDDLDHIFDRFYRADNARDFERGTGLGLAIVHRIIELHHGTVQVESHLGQGTKFIIRLTRQLTIEKNLTL